MSKSPVLDGVLTSLMVIIFLLLLMISGLKYANAKEIETTTVTEEEVEQSGRDTDFKVSIKSNTTPSDTEDTKQKEQVSELIELTALNPINKKKETTTKKENFPPPVGVTSQYRKLFLLVISVL